MENLTTTVHLPGFVIESIKFRSSDSVQGEEVENTITYHFDSADLEGYFPIVKTADGFSFDLEDGSRISDLLKLICEHNAKVAASWL